MNVAENNAQIIQTIVYVPPVLMEGFFRYKKRYSLEISKYSMIY